MSTLVITEKEFKQRRDLHRVILEETLAVLGDKGSHWRKYKYTDSGNYCLVGAFAEACRRKRIIIIPTDSSSSPKQKPTKMSSRLASIVFNKLFKPKGYKSLESFNDANATTFVNIRQFLTLRIKRKK